ncbi:hypothetical protein SUGI_1078660 [Cryptomeria japonica]|nr:hypothetical protein SUGI_1078660 [Cryptomeria japonica]
MGLINVHYVIMSVLQGDLNDHNSMVKAMQGIDVVIPIVGSAQLTDRLQIVDAIKETGTVKRFLPSEFGHDIDRANPVEPGLSFYKEKRLIRRAVEAANIPYTYICCNSIAGWPYQFEIYEDGNIKEQDLLDLAKANNIPESIVASLTHDIFINGCQYNFKMEEPKDVEVCELYTEVLYTKINR